MALMEGMGPTPYWQRCFAHHSRGTFPILSRGPSFQETITHPGETAGFRKERWLKRMGNQPLEPLGCSCSTS